MAEPAARRGALVVFGAIVLVVGLVGALALWNAGDDRRREAVEGFARAPVGCDTTLDFVETGEYFVFIESAGRVDGIRGDCDVEGAYDVGSVTLEVDINVVDPDGAPVELDRAVSGLDYSEAGFVGAAAFTIEIIETDDHVVRVESPDNEVFVVAVGRDPGDGVGLLKGGATALVVLGLLLGGGLFLLGARRTATAVAAPQWAPGAVAQPAQFAPGQPPQGPPMYGQPAGPPQYPRPVPGQSPQYGQPRPPQPPQYRQPHPPAPALGQQPPEPIPIPGQPALPGQPGWGPTSPPPPPPVPQHQVVGTPPNEWTPQGSEDTAPTVNIVPPNEGFPTRLRDERRSGARRLEERPPPPPPPPTPTS